MLVGIDHLVVAVPDLDAAVRLIGDRLGIEAGGGGVHPGAGTANRLAWFGDSFLELIAVVDREQAGASWLGGPTRSILEAGGGFVSFALASDDLAGDVARLRAGGSSLTGPVPGERRRPDGATVRWLLATPEAVGPTAPPFLIQHDLTAAEWTPDERDERAAQVHPMGGMVRSMGLDLAVPDLAAVAAAYRREIGLGLGPAPEAGDRASAATVGHQRIVLRPAEGSAGPSAVIRLATTGTRAVTADLFGCRFIVEPATRA